MTLRTEETKDTQTGSHVPSIVWIVILSTVLSFLGGSFMGYNMTGWAWVISLIASILLLLQRPTSINFPIVIWLPWILTVVGYWYFSDFGGMQRSVQLLCPIVVGAAVSACRPDESAFERVADLLRYLSLFIILLAVIRVMGEITTLAAWAAHVMTIILLNCFFATRYCLGKKSDLLWWGLLAVIPALALTRTAIVVTGLSLPLTFANMKIQKRVMLLSLIAILGMVLFYTPRLQQKMFHSGTGEMSDILNKDFADSGRFAMWQRMDERIEDNLWFGHGTGAGELFIRRITDGISGYPHNDWRLMLYDYGLFGTSVFGLTMLLAVLHAYRRSMAADRSVKLFFLVGAFSFLPFSLMMYTDNITVYASFYGNLQFTLLGLAYGGSVKKRQKAKSGTGKIRIRW